MSHLLGFLQVIGVLEAHVSHFKDLTMAGPIFDQLKVKEISYGLLPPSL